MVDAFASTVLIFTTVSAILLATAFRFDESIDSKLVEGGFPMTMLIIGAGYYVWVDQGLTGILTNLSEGVFIGVVATTLTAWITMDSKTG